MVRQLRRTFQVLTLLIPALAGLGATAFAQGATEPGMPSDQKAGSVLFFNKYKSSFTNPNAEDTQINLTNTNPTESVDVHLFLVDGSTCTVADAIISLTPNQTASFRMSDFDPGTQGYIIAVALAGGVPAKFNYLIGDAYIREADGRQAGLAAVAVAKLEEGPVATFGNGANLVFDGRQYEQLPAVVAVSSFNSQTTDSTNLAIYSPSNNLITGSSTAVSVFALVYDDAEHAFSTSFTVPCYRQFPLAGLRISSGFNNAVPAGRTGWIRMSASNRPLLGAVLNRGPLFNSGHNLHHLSLFGTYTITVPVF